MTSPVPCTTYRAFPQNRLELKYKTILHPASFLCHIINHSLMTSHQARVIPSYNRIVLEKREISNC